MPVNQTDPRLDVDDEELPSASTTETDVDDLAESNPRHTSEPEAPAG